MKVFIVISVILVIVTIIITSILYVCNFERQLEVTSRKDKIICHNFSETENSYEGCYVIRDGKEIPITLPIEDTVIYYVDNESDMHMKTCIYEIYYLNKNHKNPERYFGITDTEYELFIFEENSN